jgi:hypothetical protein
MDPCAQILRKIRDLKAQLAKREAQLAEDRYDLAHRAYSINPGGDMTDKGTYVGHVRRIDSIKRGLERLQARAYAMGCVQGVGK